MYGAMNIKSNVKNGCGRGAMAVGVLLGGGLLALMATSIRVPLTYKEAEFADDGRKSPSLVISRADRLPAGGGLREALWLLDPSPLYMPVVVRVGTSGLPERPGGQAAEMFSPELIFAERRPGNAILRPKTPATFAAAADELAGPRWFDGMTRSGAVDDALLIPRVRAARLNVYRFGVADAEVTADLVTDAVLSSTAWGPVELTVVIDATGVVSRPTMLNSAGEERVDERIRDMIGRDFVKKLSLRPGIYRIEVGP